METFNFILDKARQLVLNCLDFLPLCQKTTTMFPANMKF